MRPRLPSRLSWKLLLAIVPTVVLAVSAIVWLQYSAARREILGSINKEMGLLAQETARDIDELLSQRYQDLLTLSETPLIADYYHNVDFSLLDEAETYRKELQRYLARFSERSGGYAAVLYLDRRGRAVCHAGTRAADAATGLPAEDFASAAQLPGGGVWVSPVEDAPGAGQVVWFVKPARDDQGALKGMLVLGYDLTQMRARLEGIVVGKRGSAHVETSTGRRIEGRAASVAGERISASHALERRPWTVVVEAPLDDFLEPLRAVKNAAVATSFAGVVALVAVLLLMVRSITRPIAVLVAAARRIGEGRLDERIPVVSSDELGALSGAFNEMAVRLEGFQSQLIQAEKLSAVGQLISSVAHELNNPLGAISGYVQVIMLEGCPPKLQEDLQRVYNNVLRCRKVVDNLLFFVRKSGRERKKVNVGEAVDSALELLEYRLRKTEDVKVTTELAADAPKIDGDLQQIVQVVVNLVGNACDAMEDIVRYPDGKRLTVRTRGKDGRVFIEIEDNGSGIPPEALSKIFEPFFTTKPPGRGTGLGLPVCQQIVREHGGEIIVESRPGVGTLFRLDLPAGAAEAQEAESRATPPPLPPVPGKRVLVADDEKGIAELVARLMREDGDTVDIALHGGEALKLIKAGSYDLVISDVEMEHAKGMDLYTALAGKDGRLSTPMLFITGDILNPRVLEFLSKTGCEYLAKPFDIQDLRQAARRLLSGRAAAVSAR